MDATETSRAGTAVAANSRVISLSRAGYRALEKNRLEDAEDYFDQILAMDPRNSYALVGLAELARKRRDLGQALRHYGQCLSYEPRNRYALKGAAECSWETRQYARAVDLWRGYMDVAGPDTTVLAHLGDAYRKLGDRGESQAAYERALERDAGNRYALNGLGNLYYDTGRYQEAADLWDQLLALDPKNIRALTAAGNCYRKLRQFEKALQYFSRAGELEWANIYVLYGVADCKRGLADHEGSLTAWQEILRLSPGNKVILTRAGDVLRGLGELEQAADYYRRALRIGFDPYAEIGLASIAAMEGNNKEAIARLLNLKEREPSNARVVRELVACYRDAGDEEGARAQIDEFLGRGGHLPGIA